MKVVRAGTDRAVGSSNTPIYPDRAVGSSNGAIVGLLVRVRASLLKCRLISVMWTGFTSAAYCHQRFYSLCIEENSPNPTVLQPLKGLDLLIDIPPSICHGPGVSILTLRRNSFVRPRSGCNPYAQPPTWRARLFKDFLLQPS